MLHMKENFKRNVGERNVLSIELARNSVIDDWLNYESKRTGLSRQDVIRLTLIEKIDDVEYQKEEWEEWKES